MDHMVPMWFHLIRISPSSYTHREGSSTVQSNGVIHPLLNTKVRGSSTFGALELNVPSPLCMPIL
jgi:hypothetical protein